MQKLILTFGLLLFGMLTIWAQEETETVVEKPEKTVNSISRDRVIFELNYTDWYDQPEQLKTDWYNRGMNLFFLWDIPLGNSADSRFAFAPGIGISYHNVYNNARIEQYRDPLPVDTTEVFGQSYFNYIDEGIDVRNNKLGMTYFEVPLELRYRSKADKFGFQWKVAVGMRVGYVIHSNAKYKGEIIDEFNTSIRVKTKDLSLDNINTYRFGPSLRFGYGNVSLVGYMALNTLFEENRGPAVKPFSIGISFNSF